MKAEYINPFIQASQSVINMLSGANVQIGKPYLRVPPYFFDQIVIVIGVVGEIKGQIYFEMTNDTAKSIASAMMGGMPVNELDEISKSAISEMGNMIMGNAGTLFFNNSIEIDITPPTLLSGNIEMSNKISTVVVPLELSGMGTVHVNINAEAAVN
jgi:chemotaxis protein CheX